MATECVLIDPQVRIFWPVLSNMLDFVWDGLRGEDGNLKNSTITKITELEWQNP